VKCSENRNSVLHGCETWSRTKDECVREEAAQIFSPKKVKITEDWRKLHYEKLHDLYFSNITVNKSKRKRRVGHVEGRGRTEIHTLLWLENMKKKEMRLEDLSVDGTAT